MRSDRQRAEAAKNLRKISYKDGRSSRPLYDVCRWIRYRAVRTSRGQYTSNWTICDRWADSLGDFITDVEAEVGLRPSSAHRLLPVDGWEYRPGNIDWEVDKARRTPTDDGSYAEQKESLLDRLLAWPDEPTTE